MTLANVTSLARYPNPAKRWAVTKRAMRLWLAVTGEKDQDDREYYTEWIEDLPPVISDNDYFGNLEAVREYAEQERSVNLGNNCDEGTDRFLRAFGMEPESRTTTKCIVVYARIIMSVTNDADVEDTRRDVEDNLSIHTRYINDLDDAELIITEIDVDVE